MCPIILSNIWHSAASLYIKEARKVANLWNKNLYFKSVLLVLTISTNCFHSANLFCCFSRYQAPTNGVAPSFCIETTHNPQFLDSLRRRANARNVSFRIPLRRPIYIIIHQTHYEKSDWSRAFNQFTIACGLDMINAISNNIGFRMIS